MDLKRIDPEEAQKLLDSGEGYVYLDVRTEEEFRAGHVPGAVNIAVMLANPAGSGMIPNLEFAGQVAERFPPESKLITACLRGGRSLRAAQVLVAEGFTDVVDMRGGYDGELDAAGNVVFPGWARRGLPTTTDS